MKLWIAEHNGVLQDIKGDFEIVSRLEDADRVVLWNDVQPEARAIARYAKSLRKPTIVVQHGRKGTSKYYRPFCEPIVADKLLVWGPADKDALVEHGQNPRKIEVTGTTIFDHLKPRRAHDGINVVFCPEHWDRPVEENRKVRNHLRRLKGVNVITKLIEVHDPAEFDNPVVSNREHPDHLDICAEVLATADVVVGISESTFELLAQALDIPVVIMEEWTPKSFGGDIRYTNYRRVISDGAKRTPLKDLNDTIMQQLAHPEELTKERRAAAVAEGSLGLNARATITNAIINA